MINDTSLLRLGHDLTWTMQPRTVECLVISSDVRLGLFGAFSRLCKNENVFKTFSGNMYWYVLYFAVSTTITPRWAPEFHGVMGWVAKGAVKHVKVASSNLTGDRETEYHPCFWIYGWRSWRSYLKWWLPAGSKLPRDHGRSEKSPGMGGDGEAPWSS